MDDSAWLLDHFPKLVITGYRVTSPSSLYYNCVAWAVHDDRQWWQPGRVLTNWYWPPGIARDESVATYVAALATAGYTPCADTSLVPDIEKIAVLGDAHGEFTHVARQLANGWWASKLGIRQDIEHASLSALEGTDYGTVVVIMQRPRIP